MDRKSRPPPRSPHRAAYQQALGWLARRDCSRHELWRRLQCAGHQPAEIEAALERLRHERYQDQDRFSEMMVRKRIAQGYGPLRIHAELSAHGVAAARVRQLLDAVDIDWAAVAVTQLRRRYGGIGDDQAQRLKQTRFLLRRGFAVATVNKITGTDVDQAGAG